MAVIEYVVVRTSIREDQEARVALLRYASQVLYTRRGLGWYEIVERGLASLEAELRVDAAARGIAWEKLMRDAGWLLARRRRVARREAPPRAMGSGVYPPESIPEKRCGYHSLGVRAMVDEG